MKTNKEKIFQNVLYVEKMYYICHVRNKQKMYNNFNDRTMSDIKLVSRYLKGERPRTEEEMEKTLDALDKMMDFLEDFGMKYEDGAEARTTVDDLYDEILKGFGRLIKESNKQ